MGFTAGLIGGIGGGIISKAVSGSSPSAPEMIDPGQAMGEYLFGSGFNQFEGVADPRLQSRLLSAEQAFRPRYRALDLQDIQSLAYGVGDTPGLFGLLEDSANRASSLQQDQLEAQRSRDVSALKRYSPQIVSAYRSADPYSVSSIKDFKDTIRKSKERSNRATRFADDSYNNISRLDSIIKDSASRASAFDDIISDAQNRAASFDDIVSEAENRAASFTSEAEGELSPERKRLADQATRRASLARGRIGDSSSIATEILNREGFRSQLRNEASRLRAEAASRRAERTGLDQISAMRRAEATGLRNETAARRAEQAGSRSQYLQSQNLASQRLNELAGLQGSIFNMNRALAGDIGSVLLGRPSSGIQLGGQVLGQAQGQFNQGVGPRLFDPNAGINLGLNQQSNFANYSGAIAQADATRDAAIIGGLSSLGTAAAAAGGFCWVAREVYGEQNPKWLLFRQWMFESSPEWFFNLYIKYGESFAEFIKSKDNIKNIIRKFMDSKIESYYGI